MENTKINYGRMIMGGVLAAVVLFAVGFLIHGVVLADNYKFFEGKSIWSLEYPKKYGMLVDIGGHLVSGMCLSFLYVIARKFGTPGPMIAILVGFLVGLSTISGISAEYAFYNFGKMIPLMSLVNNIVGCILATLLAGLVYKD
jgi:fluoride ion exporter CrcB/FEX